MREEMDSCAICMSCPEWEAAFSFGIVLFHTLPQARNRYVNYKRYPVKYCFGAGGIRHAEDMSQDLPDPGTHTVGFALIRIACDG